MAASCGPDPHPDIWPATTRFVNAAHALTQATTATVTRRQNGETLTEGDWLRLFMQVEDVRQAHAEARQAWADLKEMPLSDASELTLLECVAATDAILQEVRRGN